MEFTQLLADFGRSTGMEGLALDDQGMFRLVFDERYAIDIAANQDPGSPPGFLLMARLGSLPPESDARLLRRMLAANLFARRPNDAFVGLDTELNEIALLCRHECTAMDSAGFEAVLMDFLDQAQGWCEFIARGVDEPAVGSLPADAPEWPPQGGFIRG